MSKQNHNTVRSSINVQEHLHVLGPALRNAHLRSPGEIRRHDISNDAALDQLPKLSYSGRSIRLKSHNRLDAFLLSQLVHLAHFSKVLGKRELDKDVLASFNDGLGEFQVAIDVHRDDCKVDVGVGSYVLRIAIGFDGAGVKLVEGDGLFGRGDGRVTHGCEGVVGGSCDGPEMLDAPFADSVGGGDGGAEADDGDADGRGGHF